MLKDGKVLGYRSFATSVAQKKYFFIFIATINQSHSRIEKCFFVLQVAIERKKSAFLFPTC